MITYFAAQNSNSGVFFAVPIVLVWIPAHYIFARVYTKYRSKKMQNMLIDICCLLTIALVGGATWFGHVHPSIASLGSSAQVNLMWIPSGLLALGIWAGFLSGYMKMKIDKHWP